MPTEQASVIAEFGNCSGPLDHRAPITVDSTPDGAPTKNIEAITPTNLGDYYYTARFSNWNSHVVNNTIEGGYTVIVDGTLYADYIVGQDGEPIDTSQIVTVEVISDIQYNTSSHKWQKKVRNIKVLESDAESDWIDVHQAELLATVVRESTYDEDVSDTFVNRITSDVWVLETGAQSTDNVFDTEACFTETSDVVQSMSGAGNINVTTDVAAIDTTAGEFTVNMPVFADATKPFMAEATGTGGNLATVAAQGADTVRGLPSIAMTDGEVWMFWKGATEWRAKKLV